MNCTKIRAIAVVMTTLVADFIITLLLAAIFAFAIVRNICIALIAVAGPIIRATDLVADRI